MQADTAIEADTLVSTLQFQRLTRSIMVLIAPEKLTEHAKCKPRRVT